MSRAGSRSLTPSGKGGVDDRPPPRPPVRADYARTRASDRALRRDPAALRLATPHAEAGRHPTPESQHANDVPRARRPRHGHSARLPQPARATRPTTTTRPPPRRATAAVDFPGGRSSWCGRSRRPLRRCELSLHARRSGRRAVAVARRPLGRLRGVRGAHTPTGTRSVDSAAAGADAAGVYVSAAGTRM